MNNKIKYKRVYAKLKCIIKILSYSLCKWLDSNYIKDPNLTIAELLKGKIGIVGENIKITDFKKVSL